jgi:hypothetical protein
MRCTPSRHEALKSDPAAPRTPGRTFRDLVDDDGPARCDTYQQVNVTCACGAVFSVYMLVSSVPVDAAYITAEHARVSAAAGKLAAAVAS